ncbi:MAG: collagenase [Kangiellaceae bacterium]|nr:collagenase [Kangiellaceae bacterium]
MNLSSKVLCISLTSAFILNANAKASEGVQPLIEVLSQTTKCSETIVIRSQNLTEDEQLKACKMLRKQETTFHQLFNTQGKPVKHDLNQSLRVNVYASRDDYVKHASNHFNMPTDNGGMYLEGFPDKPDNQAEFVTYQRVLNDKKVIWNLQHEYVHYLDGRYNIYGDFCASLHDSHSPPENCPKPAPLDPHTVWWTEGIAELVAKGESHPRAFNNVVKNLNKFKLSDIFNTSYEHNGGGDRVYYWGYFAARYMMEKQRDKIEQMLTFLRAGDFPRYQALIRSWDNHMDEDFERWLRAIVNQQSKKSMS